MSSLILTEEEPAEDSHMFTANSNYIAKGDKELTVFEGDSLKPLNAEPKPDWTLVKEVSTGNVGIVPLEICETPKEREARINADFNAQMSDEQIPSDSPRKVDSQKRVSFAEEPNVIPISEPNGPELQRSPDEDNHCLEEEFENCLNLREILSTPIADDRETPPAQEKFSLRIYMGNINGPADLHFKTVLANECDNIYQIEKAALEKYEISYGKLELVHAENGEKLELPIDFTLLQARLLAKKATRIFQETKTREEARVRIRCLIEESGKRGFSSLSVEKTTMTMESKFKLVLNTDPLKTDAFTLQIFDKREKKSKRLTVEYQDRIGDIVGILNPKVVKFNSFGRLGGKEVPVNLEHSILDTMSSFDCGPDNNLDTGAFVLVIDAK
jgi:hypothetical protein